MGTNMQLEELLLFQQPTSHDVDYIMEGRKVGSLTYMSLKRGESSNANQRGPYKMILTEGKSKREI